MRKAAIACTFIWIGFVCAISFMEAWLKFQAPGITIPLGLGIGRLVFGVLNKVEWVMALVIMCSLLLKKPSNRRVLVYILIPFVIVVMQTFWLLPVLDARAQLHIDGAELPTSNLHFVYIIIELFKVLFLLLFGFKFLNQDESRYECARTK